MLPPCAVRALGLLFLAGWIGLLAPGQAVAVPDALPGQTWRTVQSDAILVHYTEAGRPWAEAALAAALRARGLLAEFTGRTPRSDIHIVIVPDSDLTNGLATPLPRNLIRIYPLPPRHVSLLQETSDWIGLLVTHEMLHIYHLDWAELPMSIWRVLFGRAMIPTVTVSWGGDPFELPLGIGFPNALLPDTLIEGWAVWAETALTGTGRASSALSLSLLRNLVRDDALPSIGGANGWRRAWPGGQSGYQLGGAFHRHQDERNPGGWADTYKRVARGLTPLLPSIPFARAQGESALAAWRDFAACEAAVQAIVDAARAPHVEGVPFAGPWQGLVGPRYLGDGTLVATVDDGLHPPHTGVIDGLGGFQPLFRRTGGRSQAGPHAGDLVFDALAWYADQVLVGELWTWQAGDRVQRSQGAHAFDPDRRPGALVFVQRDGPRECLVLRRPQGPDQRWCAGPLEAVLRPRLAPDGSAVVFARWTAAGRHDVYHWRPGSAPEHLTEGPDEDWLPAFGPDGRTIYAVRMPDGIPDLYRRDPDSGRWTQVTRTRHGVWDWDLSPDGTTLVYTSPGGDGWRLYRFAVADATGAPLPATVPVDPRLPPPTPGRTPGGPPLLADRPYRAWRTMWPTAWAPALAVGGGRTLAGASLAGSDVLQTWSWSAGGLWQSDGGESASLSLGRNAGALQDRLSTVWFPDDVEDDPDRRRLRAEWSRRRLWRRTVERVAAGTVFVAVERDFSESAPDLQPGLRLAWDGRQPWTWGVLGGTGLTARATIAADLPPGRVAEETDGRGEAAVEAVGRLIGRSQGRAAAAVGGHVRSEGKLDYTLWAAGAGSFGPRSYVSRAISASRGDIDQFALADLEFALPLWWPQAGPGLAPFMLDHLGVRLFAAGALWQRGADAGHALSVGAELAADTILGFGWALPLRLGARRGLIEGGVPAEWSFYLGIGYDFGGAAARIASAAPAGAAP